jgi:hypothetical protein
MAAADCEPTSELCLSRPQGTPSDGPSVPHAGAISLGTSRHETASFAPIASLRNEEASHGPLAKVISSTVSIQFIRRLDDRRFDVGRGAGVYRPARARLRERLSQTSVNQVGPPISHRRLARFRRSHAPSPRRGPCSLRRDRFRRSQCRTIDHRVVLTRIDEAAN